MCFNMIWKLKGCGLGNLGSGRGKDRMLILKFELFYCINVFSL